MAATATARVPTAALPPSRPSFFGTLRGEVLKLTRQRALWAMLVGGVLLLVLVGLALFGNANLQDRYRTSHEQFFIQTLQIMGALFNTGAGIVLLVSSSRLVGMEYSAGTIRILLARGVGRAQLYAAKILALLLLGAGLVLGFALVATTMLAISIQSWSGNISGLTNLNPTEVDFLGATAVGAAVSIGIAVLLGAAASILGRTLAFGIAVALGFFPADNFGTVIMLILNRVTHNDGFLQVTAYFLGPNLNTLVSSLVPALKLRPAFASPLVAVSASHVWWVIGVYSAVFLVGSLALFLRRDVLE